jgi:hypothetical protein
VKSAFDFDPGDLEFADKAKPAQKEPILCPGCQKQKPHAIARRTENDYRRAFSETKLFDVLPHPLQPGITYHVMTGGDIDGLSFLKHVLRDQALDYCLFSTWCMAGEDVDQIGAWMAERKIGRLDAYVGEIFPGSYSAQFAGLKEITKKCGGRVCVFRNHAKVFAGIGERYAFGIASSANVNTNPRTENTVVTIGRDVFEFYKDFFDGVKAFNRDFDDWTPWRAAL